MFPLKRYSFKLIMKKHSLFMLLISGLLSGCNTTPHYATFDDYPVYEGSDLELTHGN